MKKTYLKPWVEYMILFTIDDLFTENFIRWRWEKNPVLQ